MGTNWPWQRTLLWRDKVVALGKTPSLSVVLSKGFLFAAIPHFREAGSFVCVNFRRRAFCAAPSYFSAIRRAFLRTFSFVEYVAA